MDPKKVGARKGEMFLLKARALESEANKQNRERERDWMSIVRKLWWQKGDFWKVNFVHTLVEGSFKALLKCEDHFWP